MLRATGHDNVLLLSFQKLLPNVVHANRQRKNPIDSTSERDRDFFTQVPREKILELYELYKPDFKMFGYDDTLDQYLKMGIKT